MERLKRRAEKVAQKIVEAMDKLPDSEELKPLIIAELLRKYKRYGLADLVETGWNWRNQDEQV